MTTRKLKPFSSETKKLYLFFTAAFLALALLGGATLYLTEYRFMTNKFAEDGKLAMAFVELVGLEELIVEDEDNLDRLLKQIAASDDSIQFMQIENESGRVMAKWTNPNSSPLDKQTRYEQDVYLEGEHFGRVIVRFDFFSTSESVKNHLLFLVGIFVLLALAAALFFYIYARDKMFRPIRALHDRLLALSEGREPEAIPEKMPFQELFVLAGNLKTQEAEPSLESVPEAVVEPTPVESVPEPVAEPVAESVPALAPELPEPKAEVSTETAAPEAADLPAADAQVSEASPETPAETVAVDAPAETPVEVPSEAPIEAPIEAPASALQGVLVVDDEELSRKRIQRVLGDQYECFFAEECDAGLDVYKENAAKISFAVLPLVILEMMGDTDRIFDAFRALRADLPILFTTASLETMPIPAKLKEAPHVAFVEKGNEEDTLQAQVAKLFPPVA